eukprot:m.10110 g.10110  ORF g.10110 m.10110 type:complete len:348 (+) comp3687_c0_seq1:214-1257(+)
MQLLSLACLGMVVVVAMFASNTAAVSDHTKPSNAEIPEHSLHRPFLDNSMAIPNWQFSGHTVVSDQFIRLTPDRQSKRGQLFNTRAFRGNEWEVTFRFKVHGQGQKLFGDGFAFWYTQEINQAGPVFGGKDHFTGLGVFFDTYSNQQHHNHGHPYISALVNDGSVDYDHDADGTHQEVAGCQSFFRNVEFDTFVRVTYSGPVQTLTVLVDAKNSNEWEECFVVKDVFLPGGYHFGFTAATGDLADNHDILDVAVSEAPAPSAADETAAKFKPQEPADESKPFAKHHAAERDHIPEKKVFKTKVDRVEESSSSWLLTIFFLLVVVGGAAGGFFFYKKKQQQKESRFTF